MANAIIQFGTIGGRTVCRILRAKDASQMASAVLFVHDGGLRNSTDFLVSSKRPAVELQLADGFYVRCKLTTDKPV